MQTFKNPLFIKLLCCVIPFPAARKKVRSLFPETNRLWCGLLTSCVNKRVNLIRQSASIETLILGSSHGFDGYMAQAGEFNLAETSFDLYASYHLYDAALKCNLTNLKRVVLFYDVFSNGSVTERTREAFRLLPYRAVFNLPASTQMTWEECFITSRLKRLVERDVIRDLTNEYSDAYGNSTHTHYFAEGMTGKMRAKAHLKAYLRDGHEAQYVAKIAELAKINKHQCYVVLPPLQADYRFYLPSKAALYEELFEILKVYPSVKLLDFQDDVDFLPADFGDVDHLNETGARKLAAKVRAEF